MPEYLHRCEHGRIIERERCPECRPQQPTEADRERAWAFIRAAADEFITDESLAALLAAVRREAVEAERERLAKQAEEDANKAWAGHRSGHYYCACSDVASALEDIAARIRAGEAEA